MQLIITRVLYLATWHVVLKLASQDGKLSAYAKQPCSSKRQRIMGKNKREQDRDDGEAWKEMA